MSSSRNSIIGLFAVALAQAACSADDGGLHFRSSPDAATTCAPPFCIVLAADAGTSTSGGGTDAATVNPGPGPGAEPKDKPKPDDKNNTVPMIGVPVAGTNPVTFAGGGSTAAAPLAAGCTPASAFECPTKSGVCATSATAKPTDTVQGVLCTFGGPYTIASGKPAATVEYLRETAGGQTYYRFRITFDPSFVDNTYGGNAIGWGDKGHTWKDLLGSDHAELELFDNNHVMVMQLKLDYIGIDSTQSCGYASLGVSGGDGKMLVGDAKYVLGSTSSLARNLQGCGYCTNAACNGDCRVDSPATDDKWTANPAAPNWDFRVQYETWIDAAAFGSSGFGGVNVSYVHASPSKESSNTITVVPGPCPPPPEGCGPGYEEYLTSEGAATCVPVTSVPPICAPTEQEILTSEGAISCVPTTGNPPGTDCEGQVLVAGNGKKVCVPPGTCPTTSVPYLTSEGAIGCDPTGKPPVTDCEGGEQVLVARDGSKICVPPGTCPTNSEPYLTSEGAIGCGPPVEAAIP